MEAKITPCGADRRLCDAIQKVAEAAKAVREEREIIVCPDRDEAKAWRIGADVMRDLDEAIEGWTRATREFLAEASKTSVAP